MPGNPCPPLAAALLVAAACSSPPREPPDRDRAAEAVVAWNRAVLEVAEREDGFLTLKGVRAAAMAHLAMHDALAVIARRYEPYAPARPSSPRSEEEGGARASELAAVVQAGFAVAADQYPDQRASFALERDAWLAHVEDEGSRQRGVVLGDAAAAAILALREGDGWDGEVEYTWHPMAPGVYAEFHEHSGTPEGFVFGAGWAAARPFLLDGPDRFRSPPPPAVESAEYAAAFAEVVELGRANSCSRTADQTHLALWWKDFVESSHNRLARRLAREDRLGAREAARLFALLNAAVFDAYVCVFAEKFRHNHWRPYTATRAAASDGNPATEADPDWDNTHGHTYAFPSYPSAHGTASAAAMTVLADVFGEDRPFTMETPEVDSAGPGSPKMRMDPPTRSFASFADAAWECALSRVYLGIHFRYDSVAGNELGRAIGEHAVSRFPAPR